jgi:thiamine-phosphate pyrophosphorylase
VTLPEPPLLVVTDRRQATRPLHRVVQAAFTAGCRWASVREKDLPPSEQIALAQNLLPIARYFGARLTIHGNEELALAAGLDGVHLASGGNVAAARAALGPNALIGLSVHSPSDMAKLTENPPDYVVAGPFGESASKPGYGPALGSPGLAAMVQAGPVPVITIGGIEPANVADAMQAGIAGIAVMGGVMRAAEPSREVRALLAALALCRGRPVL